MGGDSIASHLNAALFLLNTLVGRRATLPPTARETWRNDQWALLAKGHELTFDPARMRISGTLSGIDIAMQLRTERNEMFTELSAILPAPLLHRDLTPAPVAVADEVLTDTRLIVRVPGAIDEGSFLMLYLEQVVARVTEVTVMVRG